MKRNTNVNMDEESKSEIIEMNAVELSDLIESKLDNKGKGRTSVAFKKEINAMIDTFNKNYGKTYSRIS